jgi:general secretion pathway protein A
MYTTYFGFREKPFTLTPNPRFIFLSRNHKEAFAHLLYGINNHYGFIELIGEVGTGKTTALRTLLGQLQEEQYRCALIFNPGATGTELLRSINQEFGIDSGSNYTSELLAALNTFLLAENRAGKTVVLVIDEAQNLQPEVLEQVRLISNLETENDKLIQIVLAGQPELEHLLERPELRQLDQRIAVRYKLTAMTEDETRAYIRHRMEVAGETGGVAFSRAAQKLIYFYTRGIPRMINILCDRSLLVAYGDERRTISAAIVARAIWENLHAGRSRRLSLVLAGITALLAVVVLGSAVAGWPLARTMLRSAAAMISGTVRTPVAAQSVSAVPPVVPSPAPASPDSITANQEAALVAGNQNNMHILAFNALMATWNAPSLKVFEGRFTVPDTFVRFAARRELRFAPFRGPLEQALGFDLPLLAVTRVPGEWGNYCLAITSADNDSIAVSPKLPSGERVRREDLARIVSGTYYLIWRNYEQIPVTIAPGEKRFEIRALQRFLKQAGFYRNAVDGDYSSATIGAVREFQRSQGIAVDESVGELTLAALSRYDMGHPIPFLRKK